MVRLHVFPRVPAIPRPPAGGRNGWAAGAHLLLAVLLVAAPLPALLPTPLAGQAVPAAPAPIPERAAVDAHIRSLEAEEARALVAGDRAALLRLWADDFTVNAPRNVVVRGRDGVLALLDNGVIDYSRFEREIEELRIDGDMGLVMGRETVHPRGSAPMAGQVVLRRYTNIWRFRGGEWVLVARHAHVAVGGTS